VVPYLPPAFFDDYQQDGDCPNSNLKSENNLEAEYRFAKIWYSNHNNKNFRQILGVGNTAQLGDCWTCSGSHPLPQLFGQTELDSDWLIGPSSFIFRGAMEWPCLSNSQIDNSTRETTNHEIGHQFYVNPTKALFHDTNCSWDKNPNPPACPVNDPGTCNVSQTVSGCLMNPLRDRFDSSHRFCGNDLICGDSGCPNGNPGCCSGVGCKLEGNGSIRQLQDPLIIQ